jgi:hypothetical protein
MDTGARSGIRTHEANATDLKSVPFDRSGIRAILTLFFTTYITDFFMSILHKLQFMA